MAKKILSTVVKQQTIIVILHLRGSGTLSNMNAFLVTLQGMLVYQEWDTQSSFEASL